MDRHFRPPVLGARALVRPDPVRAAPRPARLFRAARRDFDLAGFAGGLELFDLESGARRMLAAIETELPTTRVNDGRLDRRGRLVFGTMDEDPAGARPLGQIWSFGGRGARVLASGVRIANSIAFSPDGRRMYFADTPEKRIRIYDYDLDSGVLSGERVFVSVDGPGFPDGSTVDADGCLWNAEWGGGRVVRYAPDGRVDRVLPLPASQVTCCAFGGAGLDRLYVTTARTGFEPSALAAEPHAGALFAFDVGVSGLADAPFDEAAMVGRRSRRQRGSAAMQAAMPCTPRSFRARGCPSGYHVRKNHGGDFLLQVRVVRRA